MKRLPLLSTFCILTILQFSCKQPVDYPKPTDDTHVKMDMEDGDKKTMREKYISMVHGGDDIDWRSIEAQNAFDLKRRIDSWAHLNDARSEEEWVADGYVKGKWIERGSYNQAGSIVRTAYDEENDVIYCIGAGGPIFKGSRIGLPWTLVNDDFRFSQGLLNIVSTGDETVRIIAAINHVPYYSEDDGATWTKSSGIQATGSGEIYHQQISSTEHMAFLHKYDYWSNIKLYWSNDGGLTYQFVHEFSTADTRNIAMDKDDNNDVAYIIEQLTGERSRLHAFDLESGKMTVLNNNVAYAFGGDGRANLQCVAGDTLRMWSYNEDESFRTSVDTGKTWLQLSHLHSRPWSVGLFVPGSNPTKMMYGEVNAFRSRNGGKNWELINEWWEYYGNVEFKLHADIMCIDEYRTIDGEPFVLIGNHGGLSITYDYGETNANIGMFGLNVGQFYDAKHYPANPTRIFGGTQDQGLQKGKMNGEEADEFVQMISGDYGHLQFTGPNREHMWIVYPGGSISYYDKPLTQGGPIAGYTIESKNETVWIPPIIPSEDPTVDAVYAAGGSIDHESEGSHILKLNFVNGEIVAEELDFDFAISGGQISAMAISPFNTRNWWVATTNGHVYKSRDSGQSFELMRKSVSTSHYLYGSCILPSAHDPDVVYLSGNGNDSASPVFKSEDGGLTWSTMKKGLPQTTVFKIVANQDESLLFAATEAGPYVWIEDDKSWHPLAGQHTPNQTYWSVEYIPDFNTARFSTYGRGIWDFEVTSQDPTDVAEVGVEGLEIFPNPARETVYVKTSKGDRIRLLDLNGRTVVNEWVNDGGNQTLPVHIGHLNSGIYLAVIERNSKALVEKLVVQ